MKIEFLEKKSLLILLLIFGILFITGAKALAAQEKTSIRVGLSNSSFSTFEFDNVTIVTTAPSSIIDMASGKEVKDIKTGSEIVFTIKEGKYQAIIDEEKVLEEAFGPVVTVSTGKIGIKGLNRKGNPAYYKGMMELKTVQNKDKFNIINVLDFQTYLKGVVPNEMPVSFGLNALKAQAVAARNYASRPQNAYKNYDICDSTACQVYYGANSQTAISDRAVDETLGIYAIYNGEAILAQYSSTGGGITEDYDKVYGNGITITKPYLKSVKDSKTLAVPKSEGELKEFYTKNIPSFDMKSPKHRWKVEFDRFELEDILNNTLKSQSASGLVYPSFTKEGDLYGLEDIKVTKRGTSGKALEVEIRAVSGVWHVKKELGIRRVFKKGNSILWSGNFVVEKKNTKKYKNEEENEEIQGGDEVSENKTEEKEETGSIFQFLKAENDGPVIKNGDVKKEKEKRRVFKNRLGIELPDTFTFIGAGFGHGVGMSQYGAGFLSANGVGFDEILKHYYSGIKLGTTTVDVRYNNYNQKYVLNMYVDNSNTGTAGVLPSTINQNPMKNEVMELYNASKKPVKYVLVIDNSKKPSNLEFYVNEFRFNPNMAAMSGKILKMDITKYLKNGKNTITFMPLTAANKDKAVAFRVEIEK